jgi:hypothetical protein
MNSNQSLEISEEQTLLFFQKLKSELNYTSIHKIVALVRTVLSKVGGTYTANQLNQIITKTPPLFHLPLVHYRPVEDEDVTIQHLDELVDSLYEEDTHIEQRLFSSELEALSVVIVVLRGIDTLFKKAGIKIFNYTLSRELQQAI